MSRYRILVLAAIVAFQMGALGKHFLSPRYKSTAKIAVQVGQVSPLQTLVAKMSGFMPQDYNTVDLPSRYIKFLRTQSFYTRLGKAVLEHPDNWAFLEQVEVGPKTNFITRYLKKDKKVREEIPLEEIGAHVASWTELKKVDIDEILVQVVTSDPKLSVLATNLFTEEAVEAIKARELRDLDEAENYLQVQVVQSEARLEKIDDFITEFKRNNKAVSVGLALQPPEPIVDRLKKEIEETTIRQNQNDALIGSLEKSLDRQKAELAKAGDLSLKGLDINKLRGGAAYRINKLRLENQYLEAKGDSLSERLDRVIGSSDLKFEQKVFKIKKQIELEFSMFQKLKKELFDIRIERISTKNRVSILNNASIHGVTRNVALPKKLMLAFVLSLCFAGLIVYLLEQMFPRVKSRGQLMNVGLHFLGTVPDMKKDASSFNRYRLPYQPKDYKNTLCRFEVDSAASMAFRYLRTRIMKLGRNSQKDLKVISVISPATGDGKSVIAANLAASFAQVQKKTLLIDCDFRRGCQAEMFGFDDKRGLVEVVGDLGLFGKYCKKTLVKDLHLLPCGLMTPHSQETLSNERFAMLINSLRDSYDYIILDTPAYQGMPDSILAAQWSDIPLLVASVGRTSMESIDRAMEGLAAMDFNKIFSVLNRVDSFSKYAYVMPFMGRETDIRASHTVQSDSDEIKKEPGQGAA